VLDGTYFATKWDRGIALLLPPDHIFKLKKSKKICVKKKMFPFRLMGC